MNTSSFPDPSRPLEFVRQVWEDNSDLVSKFELTYDVGGVFDDSWYVLVRCGSSGPNAYDLAEAMTTLQRQVEEKSGLDVTLILSNVPEKRNGTHTH